MKTPPPREWLIDNRTKSYSALALLLHASTVTVRKWYADADVEHIDQIPPHMRPHKPYHEPGWWQARADRTAEDIAAELGVTLDYTRDLARKFGVKLAGSHKQRGESRECGPGCAHFEACRAGHGALVRCETPDQWDALERAS